VANTVSFMILIQSRTGSLATALAGRSAVISARETIRATTGPPDGVCTPKDRRVTCRKQVGSSDVNTFLQQGLREEPNPTPFRSNVNRSYLAGPDVAGIWQGRQFLFLFRVDLRVGDGIFWSLRICRTRGAVVPKRARDSGSRWLRRLRQDSCSPPSRNRPPRCETRTSLPCDGPRVRRCLRPQASWRSRPS